MKLQICHCSYALFSDRRQSTHPDGIQYFVDPDTGPQIEFPISANSASLGLDAIEILKHFQEIDLHNLYESPLRLNWAHISDAIGIPENDAKNLLDQLYDKGLLQKLTIKYDFEKWLEIMDSKGCLVLMTCVEKKDYTERERILDNIIKDMNNIASALVGMKFTINDIIVVPNAHLATADEIGPNHETNWSILSDLKKLLDKEGFTTKLASYGCAKFVHLVIHGHALGFIFRQF